MAPRKIHVHQGKNPLDAYPFEAFSFGSWKPAKFIKIESGNVTLHFMDDDEMAIKNGYSDIRIKSRNASLSDCTSFLRKGVDVCVLSTFQSDDSDQLKSNPVWADAKITSIDRKPHKPDCSCEYYVNFYDNQGSLGSEKKSLSKDVKVVGLDRIFILQKLGRKGHEDQPYQWDSSEDCIARSLTKLFLRNFACDISWLVVTSLKKNVSFCVRSVEKKILYQILETDTCSSNDSHIKAVNFRLEDDIFFPSVFDVDISDTKRIVPSEHDSQKVPPSVEGLRRSTRRIKAPERYLGYDLCSGSVRTQKCKIHSGKDDAKWCSSGRYYNPTSRKKHQRKDSSDLDDMMYLEPGWKGQSSRRGAERKRYRSDYSRNMNDEDEEQPRRGRALDATASKKMIDSYMKSMNKILTKEEATNEQWKEAINFGKDKETEKTLTEEEEDKISEMEMLWREMDEAMTESYLEEQTEGSNVAASAQTKEESTVTCKHNYIVDEQIGERCTRCGFVKTEIKYIFPPFMERRSRRHEERQCIGEEPEPMADDVDVDLHLFPTPAACDEPISNETNNVLASGGARTFVEPGQG